MDTELRTAPFRTSMSRVPTVLGGERAPMLMVVLASILLTVTAMTVVSFILGVIIFVVGTHGLREAFKLHPRASRVYVEFLKYRRYYPARPRHVLPMPHRKVCELGQRPAR